MEFEPYFFSENPYKGIDIFAGLARTFNKQHKSRNRNLVQLRPCGWLLTLKCEMVYCS
jgi:hypothetical protein